MSRKIDDFLNNIHNKKVAIIGLGVSNIPLVNYLYKYNADITVFDKRELEKLPNDVVANINSKGIKAFYGKDYLSNLKGFDIIFRSPSCRPDVVELIEEQKNGAEITTEIEKVLEFCPCKVIGITGSDGKTTTTSLIYEIVKKQGLKCFLGGNIGIPLFTEIEKMQENDVVILEMSSFQLMGMKHSPDISIITNISPNHLDIHKSYEEYIEAKKNIFKFQNKNGIVVLNYDNEITRKCAKEVPGKVVFFSKNELLNTGVCLSNGIIKNIKNSVEYEVLNVNELLLRGVHNQENVCTAIAATNTFVSVENQREAVKNFKGVEHRLEFVREINGVKWYNDSIGTSPTRTIAGLQSFNEKIILIAGGYDKNLDYSPIAKPILNNVSHLFLVGETSKKIRDAVEKEMLKENKKSGFAMLYRLLRNRTFLHNKKIDIQECESLEEIVDKVNKIATKNEIVLFSPASASFDLYKNFEERGTYFKKLVNQL